MAASLPIPIYTHLADLHLSPEQADRWATLAREFEARFGRRPAYVARAPGRVNLIGEHIDYALFGVFPAAVERDILVACAPQAPHPDPDAEPRSPGAVAAQNLHPKYGPQHFAPVRRGTSMFKAEAPSAPSDDSVHAEALPWHLEIDPTQLRWESYVKAGYYGVLERYYTPEKAAKGPVPVDLLVTGSVPAGSGLSSSAAMVVASTLAFLAINGKLDDPAHAPSKGTLVEMSMENEKRVGVNSGGMDQAASVIALPGSALYVTFFPRLAAEPTPLPGAHPAASNATTDAVPEVTAAVGSLDLGNSKGSVVAEVPPAQGAVFVCANSLVVADKVVSSKIHYNLRVVETLVAARVLARQLGVKLDEGGKREKITLREVLGRWLGVAETKGGEAEVDVDELKAGLAKIVGELEGLKPKDAPEGELGVTLDEMVALSGLARAEFEETYLSWVEVEAPRGRFQLWKRARHVYTEALRVLEFRAVCKGAGESESVDLEATLHEMGRLMNESQESCAGLFECSCAELDELTKIAREAGAYGSRLTGAGWGGCTVSLVPEARVDAFIAKVKEAYAPYRELEGEKLHEVIFATKPSTGAYVFKYTESRLSLRG